ncbi:MAG: hypothetical protein IJ684_02835 [Bacteroidales bacterium]|nr:hypothetical protein [Bacteroidales bacterium]
MNTRQRGQEPDRLTVVLKDDLKERMELMNDGSVTTYYDEEGDEVYRILQTRSAFRGFVGSLTELMGYVMVDGYGEWDEEGGEE